MEKFWEIINIPIIYISIQALIILECIRLYLKKREKLILVALIISSFLLAIKLYEIFKVKF